LKISKKKNEIRHVADATFINPGFHLIPEGEGTPGGSGSQGTVIPGGRSGPGKKRGPGCWCTSGNPEIGW